MDTTLILLLVAVVLRHVIGEDFMPHPKPPFIEGRPIDHENYDESDVVGNAATRAHLHALRTRARARAFAKRAKLRLHHPHLLLEQTPEQFLSGGPSEPRSELKKRDDRPDPVLGSPAPFNPEPYYESQPDFAGNWNPVPDNNQPYYSPHPSYDTVLSILPGQWKDTDYQQEYYNSYQVTPVSYVIPDNYQNNYRSADPHKHKKSKKSKKIVSEPDEEDYRDRTHFHGHKTHVHPHSYMYHGNAPLYSANQNVQPQLTENQGSFQATSYQPGLHESFSSNFQTNPPPEHQPTTNKQKTVIVLPPNGANFQISQVSGTQNAVSQFQSSHLADNFNHQTSQVIGDKNAVSQSQAPFVGYAPDAIVGAPNIISVGRNRKIWQIAGPDEADVSVRIHRSVPLQRKKRQLQFARLLLDPNAQVDVPQTLENARTAVRKSFENKHVPAYHLRNAMGSAKDAFMSSLRIPPQDLIVPSKYKIVEKDPELEHFEKTNSINEISKENPQTYDKIGSMFRNSLRSGQDALTHIGDVIHNTRKAVSTSRRVAPHLVVSSLRVPAVQNPIIPHFHKAKHPKDKPSASRYSEEDPHFNGLSQIMGSLGLLNPEMSQPRVKTDDEESFNKYYVVSDYPKKEKMYQTLKSLNVAIKAMGVNTLKDFFSKMKNLKVIQGQQTSGGKRQAHKSAKRAKNGDSRTDAINELDMVVSLASNVTNELLNDASAESSWDSKEEEEVAAFLMHLFNKTESGDEKRSNRDIDNDDEQVGSINPAMFKKIFNKSVESAENGHPAQKNADSDESVGIGMTIGKKLSKPFLGKLETKEVHGYVYDDSDSDEDYYDDYRKKRSSVNFIK